MSNLTDEMDLVVGATGVLGGEICRRLTERGRSVRGTRRLSSDPEAVARLAALGVELVEADLRERASLDAACRGIENVISSATAIIRQDDLSDVDSAGQSNLIEAAKAAGVVRFVYVSVSGVLDESSPLTAAKRTVERRLESSGLTYTILRPTYFQEAWLGPAVGFDYPNAKATVYAGGTAPISYIAVGDVAEFAVLSLEKPEAGNAVIELGGPEAVTPLEAVRIFEEVGGRNFEVQHVPEEALRQQIESAEDPKQKTFAALMLQMRDGDRIEMAKTLEDFPFRLTTVREYAERVLAG